MADYTLKQHDTWPPIQATLRDAAGPINLTTATTVKLLLKTITGSVSVVGTCTVVNASGGVVSYSWIPADTATANSYNGEFEITWSDGKLTTVPNDSYFTVEVKADLG